MKAMPPGISSAAQLGTVGAARREQPRPVTNGHLAGLGERPSGDPFRRLVEVHERLVGVRDVDGHREVRRELARRG